MKVLEKKKEQKKLTLSLLMLFTCSAALAAEPCDQTDPSQPSALCAASQAKELGGQVQTLTTSPSTDCDGIKSTVLPNIKPNATVLADGAVEVISKPDPKDPTRQLIEPSYVDGKEIRPVLNDRLEKISISIPADTPVVFALSPEEVKAHPNDFVLFFDKVDKILSLGIGGKLSVALGVAKAEEWSSGTWWQEGMRHDPHFSSLSYDVQYAIPAKSLIFLSKVNSGVLGKVVDNTSMVFDSNHVGNFGDDALATGSGYSNPYKVPVYEWVGKGYEDGVSANLHFNLPGGFYVAAGPMWTRNHYTMHIKQVANCPAGMQCPYVNETVIDPAKLNFSYKGSITAGLKISDRSSLECQRVMADDLGWYSFPVNEQYPAGWRGYTYICKFREQL